MGYFESRRPSWGSSWEDEENAQNEIYKADGMDDAECRFHERMEGRRYTEPEAGFAETNMIYPFIDRNLKTDQWTRQDDGSFVFNINGKNAYITIEDGQVIAGRWDGMTICADSLYSLENFLIR